jgi:hypothetical protein
METFLKKSAKSGIENRQDNSTYVSCASREKGLRYEITAAGFTKLT